MKTVFVSNYLNHHQIPLCAALNKNSEEFHFIATDERNVWGYQKLASAEYVIVYSENNKDYVKELLLEADVVIYGSTPHELIHIRMRHNKLSFLYSERFYKKGMWRRWNPKTRKKLYDRIIQYKKSKMYVLCASAFLPYDLELLGYPTEKCYQWGYFTAIEDKDINALLTRKNNQKRPLILWVGRLDEVKHPEVFIQLAKRLKEDGYYFKANMVGDGSLKKQLDSLIVQYDLKECVELVGAKSQEEVREYMRNSTIFVFSSGKWEGWGAVLNEAMSCGCIPVCSHMIGSVPFLIDNMENGFIYQFGHHMKSIEFIESILDNKKYSEKMCRQAFQCMKELWNADKAVERFIQLSEHLEYGKDIFFDKGPCSHARVLKENWIKHK